MRGAGSEPVDSCGGRDPVDGDQPVPAQWFPRATSARSLCPMANGRTALRTDRALFAQRWAIETPAASAGRACDEVQTAALSDPAPNQVHKPRQTPIAHSPFAGRRFVPRIRQRPRGSRPSAETRSYTRLMPRRLVTDSLARAMSRVPGLKRVPVLKLLSAAEIALLAHDHVTRLDRHERRRLVELVRIGRGRRRNLSDAEREELSTLVARIEPRLLAGHALNKLSPLPLPRRLVYGPRKRA